jgi:hypothetical protein
VATNADGATTSQNLTFTTPEPTPAAPALTGLRESARSWLRGTAAARISVASHPVGTTFRFALSEPATVTLTFARSTPGRKVAGRCVKPTNSNRHKPRCALSAKVGSISFVAQAGADSVFFDGVISRHLALKPGSYTVTVVAANPSGRSRSHSLSFTVLTPPHKPR